MIGQPGDKSLFGARGSGQVSDNAAFADMRAANLELRLEQRDLDTVGLAYAIVVLVAFVLLALLDSHYCIQPGKAY